MGRNIRQQPISAKDISDYLVEQDDFNFELKCFHACRSHGLNASHGGTYVDPVSGKPRQFDIRASLVHDSCQVQMAIECKNLRTSYPLVISRVPRLSQESFHEVVISIQSKIEGLPVAASLPPTSDSIRLTGGHSIYTSRGLVGKATTQVGRHLNNKEFVSGDEEVYEKWSQAVASAYDLIVEAGSECTRQEKTAVFTFVLPILVVADDSLWAVDYSPEGTQAGNPTRIEECTLFLGRDYRDPYPNVTHTLSHLHIYTFSGFEQWLAGLKADDYLCNALPVRYLQAEVKNRFGSF